MRAVEPIALGPHPETRGEDVRSITATVRRTGDGALTVSYVIDGRIERLRVPVPGRARVAERLWQHTCCEVFIAERRSPAYHELNFSPSGEWSAYAFERYREGTPLDVQALDPRISVRRTEDGLALDALVRLDRLAPGLATAALRLALSAVIEDRDGERSYWALRHPPGKPDFHHPDGFALELDEVRD